ncbi:hypothetical protein D3C84_1123100 [compost metagenome]
MIAEQIRMNGLSQQSRQIRIGFLSIEQPCPEMNNPRPAPARMTAAMRKSSIKRLPCGLRQFWRNIRRNRIAGMQGEQM